MTTKDTKLQNEYKQMQNDHKRKKCFHFLCFVIDIS